MSDFLDRLPSREQEKIRKQLRSPEAYERLRERVKGPEDLEREMERSMKLAELHLAMESSPASREAVRHSVETDMRERGIEQVLETGELTADARRAIEQGNFSVTVESNPDTHEDALLILTEGNVQEKIPVKQSFAEKYAGHMSGQD